MKRFNTIEEYLEYLIKENREGLILKKIDEKEFKIVSELINDIQQQQQHFKKCSLHEVCKNYKSYYCYNINSYRCCNYIKIKYNKKFDINYVADILKNLLNDYKYEEYQKEKCIQEIITEYKEEIIIDKEIKAQLNSLRNELKVIREETKNINAIVFRNFNKIH